MWPGILSKARHVATSLGITPSFPEKRVRKRKRFHDEVVDESATTNESHEESDFKINVFCCTVDYIVTDLQQ